MRKYSILLIIFVFAAGAFAQKKDEKEKTPPPTATVSKTSTPMELAKAALAAQGGDKFKNMKTLQILGTATISGSPTQKFEGTFATIYSGEKYRFDLNNPIRPFRQVYDGQETQSSMPGFMLPPLNRLGLPLLPKIEEKGFVVAELPDKSKKLGFRITSPEGYFTDFFVDEKTGQVKSFWSKYDYNGQEITTSVEIDLMRNVEGVIVPERFAQRIELGQLTFYVDFKGKEFKINSPIADDVFSMK